MIDTNIFENFEHMGVYVVDRTSLIVYYENPIARKFTGRDRNGEPCYKVHGNDSMCSSCPIRNPEHITLINRFDYNLIFAVRCEEVVWDGHNAYMITVVKQGDSSMLSEEEKTLGRMSRALKKSIDVYTEINMETMRYRQMNLHDSEGIYVDGEGGYSTAFESMCANVIHPDDVPELRRLMAPEVLHKISYESDGEQEVSVRYRLKNTIPERIMECRTIFMRDEVPHVAVNTTKDITKEVLLRKQADELESILSHVSCGVIVYNVDADSNISVVYMNEGIAALVELPKDILIENVTEDFMYGIDSDHRKHFLDAVQRIINGENKTDFTFRITSSQGHKRWINGTLTASLKEDGIIQIYGTYIDVTSDIKAQKEFQEKYEIEKRRRQDDTTVLAYGVFDLQSKTVIEMERRKPLVPIYGKVMLEDFCASVSECILLSEQKERFDELFDAKNILRLHEQGIEEQSIEYQRKLPDGNVIWVKSSYRVIADNSKNSILLFYYCNDINISKIFELMTSYMVDEDYDMIGYINLVTDEAIMMNGKNSSVRSAGYSALRSQGKYSESLEWFVTHAVVPEERNEYQTNAFIQRLKETLNQYGSYKFTLHVQDEGKGIRTKKIRYIRSDDVTDYCFFSQYDITDTLAEEEAKNKQLQEALNSVKQANEAKSTFLSRMSHDMRTPMNTIIGLTSLSLDDYGITPNLKSNLDYIRGASEFLLGLVNDVLDMSKIDSGVVELKYEPYDYKEFLLKIKTMFEPQCKEKNIIFDFEDVTLATVIMADKLRIDQVFFNIFSNAIKFTPEGGRVTYSTENIIADEDRISADYVITDTGIGMSSEFLQHIFEPFKQEDTAYTSKVQGTGLGMSIAKRLVELMGGTIRIDSKQNVGTKVTIHLSFDLCKNPDSISVPRVGNADLNILKGKRILLAEDHPLNAKIAQKLLEKKGMHVVHASNGQITVNNFVASEPGYFDAILMDIRMPMLDGLEATRAIRTSIHPAAATIPIIAMSANAYAEDVKHSLNAGMNAHIAKPIDTNILYQTLASYLS